MKKMNLLEGDQNILLHEEKRMTKCWKNVENIKSTDFCLVLSVPYAEKVSGVVDWQSKVNKNNHTKCSNIIIKRVFLLDFLFLKFQRSLHGQVYLGKLVSFWTSQIKNDFRNSHINICQCSATQWSQDGSWTSNKLRYKRIRWILEKTVWMC